MNNRNPLFGQSILNSSYTCAERNWELDDQGQAISSAGGHDSPKHNQGA